MFGIFALTAFNALAEDAKVMAVVGKAEIQQGSEWVALNVGDSVPKGAIISTGFKSELLIKVNASNIKMGPLTRMTVEQLAQSNSTNKTALFVDSGKVNVEVNKTGNRREDFKVSSPVATASVRGTSFTFGADGKLVTHTGLVSKGVSSSSRAAVAESDEIAESADETETKKANVFTSVFSDGIPVFAGQTSETNSLTGQATSPQTVAASNAALTGGTATLASRESVATSASSPVSASSADSGASVAASKGSLVLNITLGD